MENRDMYLVQEDEDMNEKRQEELVNFTADHEISSGEMQRAYELALGFGTKEGGVREEVFQLAKQIKDKIQAGMPLNRVVEIVNGKAGYEQLENDYYGVVDAMQVTDKERDVLKSIVREIREGELVIMDSKTKQSIMEISVRPDVEDEEERRKISAFYLMDILKDLKDQEVEIVFNS